MKSPTRTKKRIRHILTEIIGGIRSLERDIPLSKIAWLEMKGEMEGIDDEPFRKDLMSLSRKANDYKKRYWKIEESSKQEFLHYMSRIRFLPSTSPEVETLKNNLPAALILSDGRLWTYSYDHYIKDIAAKVGRRPEEAPKGAAVFGHMQERFGKEIGSLRKEAGTLLASMIVFRSRLDRFISTGSDWSGIAPVAKPEIPRIEARRRPLILKRPFPLPGKRRFLKRPRLRRLKRKTIGPGDRA